MKLRGFEFDKVVGLIVKGGMMGMTHAQGLTMELEAMKSW